MSGFTVALCDLQPKDARLLEIVLTRAPNRRYEFRIARSTDVDRADIAIVDTDLDVSLGAMERLRARGGNAIEVHVSNSGEKGTSKYEIARSHLVLHCFRLLENIAASKMQSDLGSPAPVNDRIAESAKRPAAAPQGGLALRALVVDDSPTIRTQLEVALQRCGLKVTAAADGEGALVRAQSEVFDLVLLDIVMPGINGYELCRAIRALPSGRHLPVVMLTSRSSPFDRARGALAGCDIYLVKPVTLKELYAVVDKSLKRRFSVDEIAARGYRTPVV